MFCSTRIEPAVYRSGKNSNSLAALLIATAFVMSVCCIVAAQAGDMVAAGAMQSRAGQATSLLDGQVFSGKFGIVGKDALGEDTWVFEKGTFLSKSCEQCGFPQSPYWVRFENGEMVFKTETRCPVTDATIIWKGTIKDERISGIYTWTKKRWYWTVKKEFWFAGTLRHAMAKTSTP